MGVREYVEGVVLYKGVRSHLRMKHMNQALKEMEELPRQIYW